MRCIGEYWESSLPEEWVGWGGVETGAWPGLPAVQPSRGAAASGHLPVPDDPARGAATEPRPRARGAGSEAAMVRAGELLYGAI